MIIHVLPPEVATQIAAGEVIERPASVVKELIENSLDAGASAVVIELQEGGRKLIRVSDNGSGIDGNEIELAFVRHATSKLSTIHDLEHIQTLGFRGEALASIASVSRVTAITRVADAQAGSQLHIEGGKVLHRESTGAPQGTLITVENLFFNVPARLKFLKKEASERQLVTALVSRYAIAYPAVRFTLVYGQQEVLRTTGSGDLRQTLVEVLGADVVREMLAVSSDDAALLRDDLPSIQIHGYVGLPSLNRSSRSQITLFVNGRWVQDSSLTYAVIQAYHTLLMVGRYPVAVLLITLPPGEVDVNVHPAKAQVRFRNPDALFSSVQRVVRGKLIEQAPPPAAHSDVLWGSPDWAARRDRLTQVTGERLDQLGLNLTGDASGRFAQQRPPEAGEEADQSPAAPRQRSLPVMRVVGQVGGTYVVAEGPRGLYLIDQHAAHERILYEQFIAERNNLTVASQELLEAVVIELPPDQMALFEESQDALRAIGFGVEAFGRASVRIQALPSLIAQGEPGAALLGALGEIECGEMPAEATAEQRLISKVCKQVAVKAGQVLSYTEMEALVRQLEACAAPQTCPHGRPTMLHLSAEELARQFGRLGAI
jgi:DNA mismatch repair protein MutL